VAAARVVAGGVAVEPAEATVAGGVAVGEIPAIRYDPAAASASSAAPGARMS
jgi:hypothetical protein